MGNNIKEEIDKIEIPKELRERSKAGVLKAKSEMKKQKSKWLFYGMPMIAVAMTFIFLTAQNIPNKSLSEKPSVKSNPEVTNKDFVDEQSKKINLTDSHELVQMGDYVFIGEVIKKTGEKKFDPRYPQTQFNVKVKHNIKGKASNTVTVNQQGGYQDGKLVLSNNDQLLQEGKTYLFITSYMTNFKWHNIVFPVLGEILIRNEDEKKKLIEEYTKAIEK